MKKWIEFVKQYMNEHKLTWACALTEIKQKKLYNKYHITGGGKYQEFVRSVMKENNVQWYDAICKIQKEQLYKPSYTLKRSKRLRRNQTSKVITPIPDLVSASLAVTEHPMIVRASNRVEQEPTIPNIIHYTTVLTHMMKSYTLQTHSYSPSINKQLQLIKNQPIRSILGCGLEDNLKKTYISSKFKIQIGNHTNGSPRCVSASTKQAKDMFRRHLNSYVKLDPTRLIFPMQRHTNCWFNTMFVCFFISDKGKKFMRFFRHMMIEGKLLNGKTIEPGSLRDSFLLFNAMIEACYNQGSFQNEYSLAINTNNIIYNIYNSIPSVKGIKNVDNYGNPYDYYRALIQYLEAKQVSVKMKHYNRDTNVTKFLNSTMGFDDVIPDIVIVTLSDDTRPSYANVKDLHKPTLVQYSNVTYRLDSVICRDIGKNHFCCGITCNHEYYLYDGSAFSKLGKQPWPEWLNQDYNWKTYAGSETWNFMKGSVMLYYYRV
uniref:Uncharacterized protein n=1 Tax=viral metagenome TaxID=1070528 RepID=A0A6C0JX20_9ZZZZ